MSLKLNNALNVRKLLGALIGAHVLLVLSGCAQVKRRESAHLVAQRLHNTQHEARFADIFIPLGVRPLTDVITDNSYGYLVTTTTGDLVHFYCAEMERFGWSLVTQLHGPEIILFFQKPHKYASVTIRAVGRSQEELSVLVLVAQR